MKPVKILNLMGGPAEILIDGAMSQGSCTLLLDLTPPGGDLLLTATAGRTRFLQSSRGNTSY